jgi:ubiquinone/menaquinone biosynthesis C-methylase UbiE
MSALYDNIGINYAELRKPDPRIAKTIEQALGAAKVILNVGAGTGAYEPTDRQLTAIEPSLEMIRQRSPSAARAIQASADDLPFEDGSFEASMAILTVHHWPDKEAGLREMRRVTHGPIVLLIFDPSHRPWLTDYLPQLATLDEAFPTDVRLRAMVGQCADFAVAGAARLHGRLPVCLLAKAFGISGCAYSVGQLVL